MSLVHIYDETSGEMTPSPGGLIEGRGLAGLLRTKPPRGWPTEVSSGDFEPGQYDETPGWPDFLSGRGARGFVRRGEVSSGTPGDAP